VQVSWPLNIVITEESLAKYGRLFSFLLKMKRVVWAFQNIWKRLQMDGRLLFDSQFIVLVVLFTGDVCLRLRTNC
jgi:hypothetical protein